MHEIAIVTHGPEREPKPQKTAEKEGKRPRASLQTHTLITPLAATGEILEIERVREIIYSISLIG